MMYEDTYRMRQLNDLTINQENHTIAVVRKCLKESEEQTNKMTNILNSFEDRLSVLHNIIVPVYDATNILQIKFQNLGKAVTQLEKITEYYDSVKNLSMVIQAGPGKDINSYLLQLNRLKSAIEYFAVNKNQSLRKQNEELWLQGKQNVDREFELLLNKISDNGPISFESSYDQDKLDQSDDLNGLNIKENDLKQIISIIEWFKKVESTYLDKLYEKIIRNRSQTMLDVLKRTKDKTNSLIPSSSVGKNLSASYGEQKDTSKRNSLSTLSPNTNNLNSSNGNLDDGKKYTGIRSRLTENLFNNSSDVKKKTLKPGLNLNDSMNGPNNAKIQVIVEDFETTDCVKFVQCVRIALNMFSVENKFITKIIDGQEKIITNKILERIFDPILRYLNNDAERLSNNAKQVTNKCTSKYIIAMFSVLSDLVEMKQNFLKIFEQTALPTKTTRHIGNSTQLFLEMFINIEKACYQSLKNILDEVGNDPKAIQPNGNIHPITTETITFIENLLPFDYIAGFIAALVITESQLNKVPSEIELSLRREASTNNEPTFTKIAYNVSTENEKKNYRIALAEYFYKLFLWLNYNLKKKSENYDDINLKWIFLLNNSYKISKLFTEQTNNRLQLQQQQKGVKCKNLNELFLLAGKNDMKSFYDKEILDHKREYSKCWSRLLLFIKDLNDTNPFYDSNKLKDKDRQLLKDKFGGFNKEFEDIYEAQKHYYIPNEQAELAQMLRQDNILYIVTQYKRFYDVYSKYNFATNREKYIKYTPELLEARMREFFSAN